MIVQILTNGLWQGAIVVAIALLVSRFFARESASTRYAVWFVALIGLVAVPVQSALWPIHLPSFDSAVGGGSESIRMRLIAATTAAEQTAPLMTIAFALWCVGMVLAFVRLAVSAVRISRIRRSAAPLRDYDGVFVSDMVQAPIAAGLHDPIVIVPAAIFEQLPSHDISLIVAHERAHIARHDIIANFMQRVVEAVLFFNPWVYVISHYLVKEREAACDDAAVSKTGLVDDYAACLAAVARAAASHRVPLVSPSVFGSRRALIQRIERLVDYRTLRTPQLNYYTLGGTIVIFAAATLVLQLFSPALAASNGGANTAPVVLAAASCEYPNKDAKILIAQPPKLDEAWLKKERPKGEALVYVGLDPEGKVVKTKIAKSSGNATVDQAAIEAAQTSTYAPATRNCQGIPGEYLFQVQVAPNP